MNKYFIQVKQIKEAREFIKEQIEDKNKDINYYTSLYLTRGADKQWCNKRLGKEVLAKENLDYIDYILKFNQEIFEELIKENKLEPDAQLKI